MMKLSNLIMLIMLTSLSSNSFAHSGRTDSNGGHNCSEASKRKGLCTGYHYHKRPKFDYRSIEIDQAVNKKEKTKDKSKI